MFLLVSFRDLSMQQLYISSCPEAVPIQTQVNTQCTSQPADCSLPYVPITDVFQALSIPSSTPSVSCNCLFTFNEQYMFSIHSSSWNMNTAILHFRVDSKYVHASTRGTYRSLWGEQCLCSTAMQSITSVVSNQRTHRLC